MATQNRLLLCSATTRVQTLLRRMGPVMCRFLGRLHDAAIHARRRQASEKRQGTKSR